ncbi:MAG: hypothetical protein JSR95_03190 [Proteobacteria bacterium]|nr:hypothetical protein [Pseudomonadota bacterium]
MHIDIRIPLGFMFSLMGLMLVGLGLTGGSVLYRFGLNVNLIWGLVMLAFGASMLWLARR